MSFSSLLPQDKALHSVAAPAPGPSRVQAQWRDEGVPGGRPFTADPDGAPPLSAGPQAAEGPPGGPALRPEAGRGRCDHQGLCQIHSETADCHRGEKGQVTEDGRGRRSSSELLFAPQKISWRGETNLWANKSQMLSI